MGGVAGVVLILLLVWWLRKRGKGEEQLSDVFWTPGPAVGPPVGHDEDDGEERLHENEVGMMREKADGGLGGGPGSQGHGSAQGRQSWYGGGEGATGTYRDRQSSVSDGYGGYGDAYGGLQHQEIPMATGGFSDAGLSHRRSMQSEQSHYSRNSQSHDGFGISPPVQSQSQSQPQPLPLSYCPTSNDGRAEELVERSNSLGSDRSESARTAATTGSSVGYPGPSMRSLAFTPARAVELPRPPLEGQGSSSTNNSGESSLFSQPSSRSSGKSTPDAPKPFLGRPAVRRQDSDDSLLIVPSQFLGARIVNGGAVTPAEERT